ncbi:MAG: type II toxin-antitoxin system VapC family toxin [Polyangiales bacterium]
MRIAIDTNVLLDVLRPNPAFVDSSRALIEHYATCAQLIIAPMVYAELAAGFGDRAPLDAFCDAARLHIEPQSPASLFLAGQCWRRHRAQGGRRERVLADFLVGAHAQVHASKLLSRDRGFYRSHFDALVIEAELPARA